MKTITQFLLILFVVAITTNAHSNEKIKVRADTVRVKFENYLLEVATFDLKHNTLEKAVIKSKINNLLKAIENVEIKSPEIGERIIISYSGFTNGAEIDFKKLQLSTTKIKNKTIIEKDGKLLETDFGNIILELEDKNYLIRLHLEKLEDAQNINSSEFDSKILTVDNEIPENRKKTNAWFVENDNDSFISYSLGEVPPLTLDVLELNAGVGAGWIQNQFVSGFNFRVGIGFKKKGIFKDKYFADYELLYDFSNADVNNKFELNGFLSLGYERNFSLDPKKTNFYGLSVGYLLGRGNEFFEKNTFKVAFHKNISNSITLKPEIYFNDFFKNISPGLRVQIAF